jgi:hypothetical protein
MKNPGRAILMAASALLMTCGAAFAQPAGAQGQGQAVVTVLPKGDSEALVGYTVADMKIKVDGRNASVTKWTSLRSAERPTELVILIDGGSQASLTTQFEEISGFVKETPANTKVAIAYMENGRAVFSSPLSADGKEVQRGLRIPFGGAGSSASPYFCLSDLAKQWPSKDPAARRVVVMISDGVDNYGEPGDLSDPYMESAIRDAVRARLIVYPIYWRGRGMGYAGGSNAGQSLLVEVADATGGKSYWMGSGDPVSFEPYFRDLRRRLRNQYLLSFSANLSGKPAVESLHLKISGAATKVDAPQQVFVSRAGE